MSTLVTGASSDIGFEIIKDRVKRGETVYYTCSNQESLEKVQEKLSSQNIKAAGCIYNFSDYEQGIKNITLLTKNNIKNIILNAATRNKSLKKIHELDDKEITESINQNIFGNLFLIKSILPSMMENEYGRIVLISSISVNCGTSRYAPYIMHKAALEQLIDNIAVDYGEHNILANTIRLGIFKTSRTKMFWKRSSYTDQMAEIIPTSKLGEPSQITHPLDSLLQVNQYINGTKIEISGALPKIKGKKFF
jgi:NAD(P)-dependent dehydrogenase (short-subunit alcohol dehydrogenase family)